MMLSYYHQRVRAGINMIHLKRVATNLLKVSKTFTNILEIVKKGVTTVNKSSDNNDDILQFETTTEDERLEILKKKKT